jgi:sugar phosphate isomerase/epimerase
MRAGISTASLFLKLENDEAIRLLDEWKIPITEVFLTSFSEYDPAFGKKLLKNKGNIGVNSVHVLTEQFEPQLYSRHPKVEGDSFAWLKKVMQVGQMLGAKYYTFHGVSRIKRTGNYDNFAFYGPRTPKIFDFCKDYGITLAYETVEWAIYNRPGIFQRLKADCPDLKGVLDVKQTRISGYDYRDYISDMGASIAYVHYSDTDGDGHTCLAGKGVFDIDEMLKRLQDAGFNGDILLENYATDYKELNELKESYLYLAEKIYKWGM